MTSSNVTLRVCEMADLEAVLALWERSTIGSVTATASPLRARLERDRELFLLAWDGEQLVGSLIGG